MSSSLRLFALVSLTTLPLFAQAQDRLRTLPQYKQFEKAQELLDKSAPRRSRFAPIGHWTDDSRAYEYPSPTENGKFLRYDVETRKTAPLDKMSESKVVRRTGRRGGGGGVARGRQLASTPSPDGKRKAVYKDSNLFLTDENGDNLKAITTDGSREKRIKYGTASWVYGEELDQVTAMWWSPDSKQLAFYRFDESDVKDYYLAMQTTRVQDTLDVEAYPKSGATNPVADLIVYDLATSRTLTVDARDGKPLTDNAVGYYVYNVRWSPNGKELLFHRTNRLQNIMELVSANPQTGKCRVIAREVQAQSYAENNPTTEFFEDSDRFLFSTERNGYKNYDLYSLSQGKRLTAITQNTFEASRIVRVDEKAGILYYMVWNGDTPLKAQLYRTKLDGSDNKLLTDPHYTHEVQISPDGKNFVDTAQNHNTPSFTQIISAETGKVLSTLQKKEETKTAKIPLSEMFTFKAADGNTDLHGILHFPADFDPKKKYPLLVSVYGGPGADTVSENYAPHEDLCDYGFLVASFDGRGTGRRGKAFKDVMYLHMGLPEIDDQAAGVKSLRQRGFVDGLKVGIFGTSYGGYASAMCLLRYPDVFAAAAAQSPVTAWENYDTIYTERYMSTPQLNPAGYKAGSAMTYAPGLKGRLMLYFGTADNNVHPANSLQLIAALQQSSKSFEVQIGPDREHTSMNESRMIEFFIEALGLK